MPSGDDPWYCALCRPTDYLGRPKEPTPQAPKCELCPHIRKGAFKETDDGKWAHVICALWCPDTAHALLDRPAMEPVTNISGVSEERWDLECVLCGEGGCCIQCAHPSCQTAFHPICGRDVGMTMFLSNTHGLVALCDKHKGTKM